MEDNNMSDEFKEIEKGKNNYIFIVIILYIIVIILSIFLILGIKNQRELVIKNNQNNIEINKQENKWKRKN